MTESPILEIFWDLSFGTNFREIPKIFYGFFSKKFLKISPRNSWEFLQEIPENFSGLVTNFTDYLGNWIRSIDSRNSWEFLRNFFLEILETFWGIFMRKSQDLITNYRILLETEKKLLVSRNSTIFPRILLWKNSMNFRGFSGKLLPGFWVQEESIITGVLPETPSHRRALQLRYLTGVPGIFNGDPK